jgi:hypothetical protein
MQKHWAWAFAPLVLVAILLVSAPQLELLSNKGAVFLAVLLLLTGELAVIGWLINGRPMGAFIDNRNCLSLSKLQAGAWTVVVLAAFATAAAFNANGAHTETVTALSVAIPGELLLAMGISATSLVAAPGLLSLKAQETPAEGQDVQATARLKTEIQANGKVATKSAPEHASLADLVTGDEVGNAGTPDLGKIQQALITLLLLGCYADYVYVEFAKATAPIASLPMLDKSFVWLMGISHASYLAYKAAPHTKSAEA